MTPSTTKFEAKMGIQDAMNMHPDVRAILGKYDMLCGDCMASPMDSIAEGAKMHGADIDEVLQDLNNLLDSE